MKADQLLWLYPRPWRDRYGDEFVDLFDARDLMLSQVIDIIVGAVDARLSRDARVQAVSPPVSTTAGGGNDMTTLFATAAGRDRQLPFGSRQGVLGAIVLIVGYHGLKALAELLVDRGWQAAGTFVFYASFPVMAILFLNLTLLHDQPSRPRAHLVVAALSLVALLAGLAAR
jgi:hypothetical protein